MHGSKIKHDLLDLDNLCNYLSAHVGTKVVHCSQPDELVRAVTETAKGDAVVITNSYRMVEYLQRGLSSLGFGRVNQYRMQSTRGLFFKDKTAIRFMTVDHAMDALRGTSPSYIFIGYSG